MFKMLAVVILLTSCSSVTSYRLSNGKVHEKIPANVKVYSLEKIGKTYTKLGIISASADAGENAEKAVILLRKEAAKMGADAIVGLSIRLSYGFWANGIEASGIAVKFN